MRRISGYFISVLLILNFSNLHIYAQDTILIPLKIKVGFEVSGPAIYMADKNIMNYEAYFAYDINEKLAAAIGTGFLNFSHSQYNYSYLNKGMFAKAGIDLNLLKPDKNLGKYWVGLSLRYGLSVFNSEVPSFQHENYWGKTVSSIARQTNWGHFIEVSPGVRAEVFKNFSMGWTVSLRMLLYSGTGKDLKPIYFPGYGNGGKSVSTGLSYFLVWNIPYKKINVILKKEVPEVSEDTEDSTESDQNSNYGRNTNR